MRGGLFRKILLAIFLSLLPAQAYCQTSEEEIPAPPAPTWNAAAGNSATPDGACQLAHQYFNPNAPYSPPTYLSDIHYACNWIARQQGGPPESNTILANVAFGGCPGGYVLTNGMCKDSRTESTICNCDDPARGVAAPPTPTKGNPVSVTSGFKVQDELDYSTADGLFQVKRRHVSTNYRKRYLPQVTFGENWQGLIPGRLIIHDSRMVDITWMQGNGESFHGYIANRRNDNDWNYSRPDGTRAKLSMVSVPTVSRPAYFSEPAIQNGPGEFRLDFGNGQYILFRRTTAQSENRSAVPIERGYANGYKQYFDYSDTGVFPHRVRDSFGRQMQLTWVDTPNDIYNFNGIDPGRKAIKTISLPDGTTLTYDYDRADAQMTGTWTDTAPGMMVLIPGRKDRLGEVRRTNASGQFIWKRTYLYEDSRFPYHLTGIKDQDGTRLSTYSYHASGLIASSERAGGVDRHTFRQYRLKTNGVVEEGYLYNEVTNPLGRKETYKLWRHTYWMPPQVPRLIMQVDGAATTNVPADTMPIAYTNNTMVSSVTDKKGTVTSYGLDTVNNRPTSITEAQGTPQQRTTTITWHPTFDLPTKTERTGLKVEYSYSAIGQALTRTETDTTTHTVPYSTGGQTRTWTYTWEPSGRLGSINGPRPVDGQGRDDVATFTYDTVGNLLTSTNALGHVTTFAGYEANGLPGSMIDANGVVTEYSYDALGRAIAIRVRHPSDAQLDAVTSFEYDLEDRVVGLTQPATDKLIFDHNMGGQLTAIRMASGERIDFTNDAIGNVTAATVKRSNGTATRSIARTFDELGRMLTETLGPGRTTKWTYDKNGNATQAVTARSFATQAAFDPLNRLVSTVAPDTGTTATAYNALDLTSSFTDAIAVQTTFVRNGFGEVVREVSPDRGSSTYHYNEAGELAASIDGRGQRVDYTRDILGRVTQKVPAGRPASETISYTWDTPGIAGSYGLGRLASVTDATGTTSFAYDHRGNLTVKRQTIAGVTADLAYFYDLADRISQIIYPSGRIIAYDRDSKGRVVQVRTRASASEPSWATLSTAMAYESWGSITSAQFGNGLALAQTWADGRLATKRLYKPATGASLSHLAYTYDNDDNISAIQDLLDEARSAYYGYDGNNRLTFAAMPTASPATSTETYSYTPGTNRLAALSDAGGTRTIAYDGRGNTLGESRPGGASVSASYDGHGRLLTYVRSGAAAQSNAYNGLDDRVTVSSDGIVHSFVYDPDGRLIGEYDNTGAPIAETIWLSPEVADNLPLGGNDGVGGYAPLAMVSGWGVNAATYWIHGNHLGVPIAFTDASGTAVPPPSYTLPGFPGQLRTLPDLYYNRYRDYDSYTGRYIQADPIGLGGGSNPYLYAEGNPLRYVDPDGKNAAAIAVNICFSNLVAMVACGGATWALWKLSELCLDWAIKLPAALNSQPPGFEAGGNHIGRKRRSWTGDPLLASGANEAATGGTNDVMGESIGANEAWAESKGLNAASTQTAPPLAISNQKPGRGRRSAPIRCTNWDCDTPHGGATGTTECPDCDGKRRKGHPLPGPPPRKIE